MDLSIVIVNYNSLKLLLNCLASIELSLQKSKLIYEIIIVDNDSTDESGIKLKSLSRHRIIFNRKNKGFGSACNQGIQRAQGKYILLLNPDITVLNNSIERLVRYKQNHNGFVGGKLLNLNLSVQASCGLFFSLPVVMAILFLKGEKMNLTKFSPREITKVDWVSGACLLGSKRDFLKIGGFDEQIFLYTEEVDLLYRAKKLGINCYYYNQAEFIHIGAAISGREKAVANIYKGLVYFYQKHFSKIDLALLRLILSGKAIMGIILGLVTFNKRLTHRYQIALKYIY